jgi:predicted PurR-regulated permease PerM
VEPLSQDVGESTVTLPEQNSAGPSFLAKTGALLLIAGLGYLVWRVVAPLWQPLTWALLFGVLLAPLNEHLSHRLGDRPRLASALTVVATVLLFMLPVAFIAGAVAAQSANLLNRLDKYMPQSGQQLSFDVTNLPWLANALAWINDHTGLTLTQLQGWLLEGSKKILQALVSSGGSALMGALGTVASLLLTVFVLFFVLRDGPGFTRRLIPMLPIEEQRRSRLWVHLTEVTRAVFMGIGVTAIVQGALVGVGFWIAGLPSPLVFGVLSAFVALIPMVGAGLVWVPAAVVLALRGDYGHAIFLAVWGVGLVSMADNFLRPLLISGRAEVPTLAVFVGVMGGLSAFGFIGLFIGPIVLGLLVALFRLEVEFQAEDEAH